MFKKELIEDYKDLLKECFATDADLIQKWHISAGQGLDACVKKTMNDLQQCQTEVFKIFENDEIVGYFGKEVYQNNIFLTGFFLIPKFRTVKGRQEFWNIIESELSKPFFCGVYEKNIPANKFIKSHSGAFVKSVDLSDGPALYYQIGI